MEQRRYISLLIALSLSAAIAVVSLYLADVVGPPEGAFVPGSFVTHTAMLFLSLLAMKLMPGDGLSSFGLTLGTYRFSPKILLWAVPTAGLSVFGWLASRAGGVPSAVGDRTVLQSILFVWIYASVCEEVLTRGLLQTLLHRWAGARPPSGGWSAPVVLSGLFFGAMHLVLLRSMGPAALVPIVLATLLGFLAARYRASTGSVVPAIIVHVLFNVGGMLPGWILRSVVQ